MAEPGARGGFRGFRALPGTGSLPRGVPAAGRPAPDCRRVRFREGSRFRPAGERSPDPRLGAGGRRSGRRGRGALRGARRKQFPRRSRPEPDRGGRGRIRPRKPQPGARGRSGRRGARGGRADGSGGRPRPDVSRHLHPVRRSRDPLLARQRASGKRCSRRTDGRTARTSCIRGPGWRRTSGSTRATGSTSRFSSGRSRAASTPGRPRSWPDRRCRERPSSRIGRWPPSSPG